MLWTIAAVVVLLGLNGLVDASITSQEKCFTKLGRSSVNPIPSSTYALTLTLTATQKVTSTPVKTITPPPVTSTSTTTSTLTSTVTAPANTQTFTTTFTVFLRSIATVTVTSTQTATTTETTTITTTSTVPTPPGFTPVSQEPGYVPKIKGRDARKLNARANTQNLILSIDKPGKSVTCSPALYPTSVICAKVVETITTKTVTKTAPTTSTTTLPPSTQTITSTVNTSTTVTSTPPDVTTTSTVTTTITIVATTTSTTTTTTTTTATQTVEVPGATSYAACAANNIVNSANGGQGIYAISLSNNALSFVDTTASSAYDCCVQCETTTTQNCVGSFFYYVSSCTLIVQAGSCTPGAFNGASFGTGPYPPEGGFTISNGPCGAIANNGGT